MHRKPDVYHRSQNTGKWSLIAVLFLLLSSLACSPSLKPPAKSAFFVFRFQPPALVELSPTAQPLREIPLSVPTGCALEDLFPPNRGANLAVELSCPFGQAVVWLNTDTGEIKQPVTDSDSHFLAWSADGDALYLKVDSINHPQILRVTLVGAREYLPIDESTYDIAPMSDAADFIFSFSRGMGLGSEMHLAQPDGRVVKNLAADPNFYLSFARWSADEKNIAYIRIPDSQTPFTVGELWVMSSSGSNARKLAEADAGHGFSPAWSPDGTRLAYVRRENPNDPAADRSAGSLTSNIYIVNVQTGNVMPLTRYKDASVGSPHWSPDGNQIAFTAVMNDKMSVILANPVSGETQQVLSASSCCAAWIQK